MTRLQVRAHGSALLRAWRERTWPTQLQAAVALGIDPSTFSKFLSGSKLPGRRVGLRIARVTGGAVPVEAWGEE